MHVWFNGFRGHPGKIAGKNKVRPFSPNKVFLFSQNSRMRFWALVLWHLWIVRGKHPGRGSPCHLAIEIFNVGGWLTHGDLALEAKVDFSCGCGA